LVSLEQLIAIDAMWSLQAFHRPFHALKIWNEIVNEGARYPVPEVATAPRLKDFPERYLWVGHDWEDGHPHKYTGLRSVLHELAALDNGGCMGTRPTPPRGPAMGLHNTHSVTPGRQQDA